MGCGTSSDSHTGQEYNSLGYHGTHNNQNGQPNNNSGDHRNTDIKPAPRDPTPPPREPTPPPRDPTPPPREPTPPPKEPTPPPREPTPPPKEPTPPPPKEPTPPPPKDPTPPPPSSHGQDDELDQERYSPTEPEFGTDYRPVGMGLHEVHVEFRSHPEPYDWEARPEADSENLYVDREFPLEVALPNHTSDHEWKRPIEIRNAPCLFSGGTERYDIGQGSVGTCWFLSVVSAIADRPKLLRRVIGRDAYRVGQGNYDGIFHCRFWRYGNWDNVYIDDYLPVIYGDRIYGARSATDENEMWVSLLEKAFARLHGSYAAVTGGLAADAYIALTGGVAEQIDFDKMQISAAELFRRIDIASKSGALMTCTVPDEHDNECGLVGGHAYSLTGAARVGDVCLVRVRNPWGKQEWKGPWCDGSPEWDSVPPGSVEQVNKEDGEFYMALDHFLYYFSNVTICNLTPDFDRDGTSDSLNHIACLYGDWRGDSAAGFENKLGNPKFVVTLGEYSVDEYGLIPFVMQIIQKNKHRKTDKMSIRCDLYQVMNDNPDTYVLKELGENTNMYRQELQVTYRFHVKPGRYVIVPSTINAGDEKEFMIRLFTPSSLQDISRE
ncbi:hypothetical protein KUTeg_008955 [Tegillarca granosa]|uniref:Calpain catalytic domain-containing protein n=1 Tax=Tegillarca granosa TaxID=220873 RepID=A0ABQ9FAK1_TEGGR|nr:hypothetical protein KUTeg_008955 [Tegillarca granosa]